MPRPPASPPPSPISARSCASRRSPFPASTRPRCSAAPRRSPSSSRAPASSRPSTSAARRSPAPTSTGQPAVLATRAARNGRPTILLYAHHDVQPVGDEALWESPPFEPTVRDGRLYGRGAADDKAGVMAHIAALRALTEAVGDDFDLGVVLFFEGEEEAGSRSFAQFLSDNADALRADVIVVADSGNWDAQHARADGVAARQHALHAARAHARPRVALRHVRRSGARRDDGDRQAARDAVGRGRRRRRRRARPSGMPRPRRTARRRCATRPGCPPGVSPIGTGTILSRIWNKPSITVTGIDAPSVANASNTLSPEIAVVISARIAPGQRARDAYAAIEAHLRAHAPFGAQLDLQRPGLRRPVPRRHERLGGRRRPRGAARGLRRRAGRHRRGRVDPVHRRPGRASSRARRSS